MNQTYSIPDIPARITVHIGRFDEEGYDVTVTFPEYVKTTVSSSADPMMESEALKAVIYAHISFALNRVSSRNYRKLGYGFDITSDAVTDQKYTYGISVFENINNIVDEIFWEYITTEGGYEPLLTRVCYENDKDCDGMSAEGAMALAQNGMDHLNILRYYYGGNVRIEEKAKISGLTAYYEPDLPLSYGDIGQEVSGLAVLLNRISNNYHTIPKLDIGNKVYDADTAEAVYEFRRIFDSLRGYDVDKAVWNKILFVYDSVAVWGKIVDEGKMLEGILPLLRAPLKYGSVGNSVKLLQYYLKVLSYYDRRVPDTEIIGVFGENTYRAVTSFQKLFGLEPNGVVDNLNWNILKSMFDKLYSMLPESTFTENAEDYPGTSLKRGAEGRNVLLLQKYLNKVSPVFDSFPKTAVNGVFDVETENAVIRFQNESGIKPSGIVTSTTWNALAQLYNAVTAGE